MSFVVAADSAVLSVRDLTAHTLQLSPFTHVSHPFPLLFFQTPFPFFFFQTPFPFLFLFTRVSQVPYVDLSAPLPLKCIEFDALTALQVSVSRAAGDNSIAINVHTITTRYHPTRLPLLYQFLRSLVPPSPPSSSPASPPPGITLHVSSVISLWARGGGGGHIDQSAVPSDDAYGTCVKGECLGCGVGGFGGDHHSHSRADFCCSSSIA